MRMITHALWSLRDSLFVGYWLRSFMQLPCPMVFCSALCHLLFVMTYHYKQPLSQPFSLTLAVVLPRSSPDLSYCSATYYYAVGSLCRPTISGFCPSVTFAPEKLLTMPQIKAWRQSISTLFSRFMSLCRVDYCVSADCIFSPSCLICRWRVGRTTSACMSPHRPRSLWG